MSEMLGSSELFRRYQPRFRAFVRWRPEGLGSGKDRKVFYFRPLGFCENVWRESRPSVSIAQVGLGFTFKYDPHTVEGPVEQLHQMVWKMIEEQVFAGREFYFDPERHETTGYVGVRFAYSGAAIPGLVLPNDFRATWHFFIPDGTAERAAIMAALTLEQNRKFVERERERQRALPDLVADEARLAAAIVAVPG